MKLPKSVIQAMLDEGVAFSSYENPHPVTAYLDAKPPIWKAKYRLENVERSIRNLLELRHERREELRKLSKPKLQLIGKNE